MPDDDTLLGGTLGGLHRRDVPACVDILLDRYPQQVEFRIRPEAPRVDGDHHYAIDWKVLSPPDAPGSQSEYERDTSD